MAYFKINCPFCGGNHSAVWNEETRYFRCHLCGMEGTIVPKCEETKPEHIEDWLKRQAWFKPKTKRCLESPKEPISDENIIKWFANRGISEETLIALGVTSGIDWMPPANEQRLPNGAECPTIHFNYFRDHKLVNTKLRAGDKCFRMLLPDSDIIPFNLDSIKDVPKCFITEGEIDALSMHEIGFTQVISVVSINEIINIFESHLKNKDFIYICADNDSHGLDLANEIKKFLKANMAKHATVEILSDYGTKDDATLIKDANECLALYGPSKLYYNIVRFIQNAQ